MEEKKKGLPDDLPSLEAIWKVELQRLLEPIKAKAGRVEQKAQAMLDRHDKRMHEHEQNKPREPSGFLARKGNYQKRMNTWSETQEHLRRRQLQLRERVNWLQEYSRDRVSNIYKSPAEQLAERRLAGEQPEFAPKLAEARQTHCEHKMEKMRQNGHKQQEQNRTGRGRGL